MGNNPFKQLHFLKYTFGAKKYISMAIFNVIIKLVSFKMISKVFSWLSTKRR